MNNSSKYEFETSYRSKIVEGMNHGSIGNYLDMINIELVEK